jgi:hypothetical protein
MQNDIIKRPPAEVEERSPEPKTEEPAKAEEKPVGNTEPSVPATEQPVVDVIKTQEVPNAPSESAPNATHDSKTPAKDGRNSNDAKQPIQQQPKSPAGPGLAIASAVIICIILVGLVVFAQISKS